MNKTTCKDFLNLINEKVNETSYNKPVALVFRPKGGWQYEVNCAVTSVLDDDIIWISNGFGTRDKHPMKLQDIIIKLNICKEEQEVAFEIYGWNGQSNEQIICRSLELSDITVEEIGDCIYFILFIDTIGSVE